jgi:hypothetical protein
MATWVERYKAGEYAEVWAEMQALGVDVRGPSHCEAAAAVVQETMDRAHTNVERLFSELLSLGYRFKGAPEFAEPDFPLELRIQNALNYVKKHGAKEDQANPWSHPALAWVEDEEIELPSRFLNGKPARANYLPPGARMSAKVQEIEGLCGVPLPLSLRAWFEVVGSVNLAGTHPVLNHDGCIATLKVTPEEVGRTTADPAGAGFVSSIRHAFVWGGFPGWDGRADAPQRELDWLRCKLLSL